MSERKTFVELARRKTMSMSMLCERFGITRRTGYKWLERWTAEGPTGLLDRSRRPQRSPSRSGEEVVAQIVDVRQTHPAWGGRKIARVLRDRGVRDAPAPSTVTDILRRSQLIDPVESMKHHAWNRFTHPSPNDLWQMDFKGHVALADGRGRCHPLTVIDDHSRYALVLRSCATETTDVVRAALETAFRQYGMPLCILADNGPPWGVPSHVERCTTLGVWIMRLGIRVSHGRPRHPQTQGKDERFHRTLKAEVLRRHICRRVEEYQPIFDQWREIYNCVRPHDALALDTPVQHYQISRRAFPEQLPPVEYSPDDAVRIVQDKGQISYRGKTYVVGKALHRQRIALRPTDTDGVLDVFFCQQPLMQINLHTSTADGEKV